MTVVTLSRMADNGPIIFHCEVRKDGNDHEYSVDAGKLELPPSPAEITDDWLPDVSDAAKELAWLLLDVIRQAGHWGTVTTVAWLIVHMLADSRRRTENRIGFRHYSTKTGNPLRIFRTALAELADKGYIIRANRDAHITPTPALASSLTN
jgi:hypothetical protein